MKIYASQDYVSEALTNKISYNEQTLTPEQQEQARKNIGALSKNTTINGKELTANTVLIADDIGVYVQSEEPVDAVDGDIWVDVDAESHLDPEIVIDSTLTKSGQAADAKFVGDALAEKQPIGDYALKSDIPSIPVTSVNGQTGDVIINVTSGKDGYTPVRGTDYWTEADKAEIKSYVDEAILGGAW